MSPNTWKHVNRVREQCGMRATSPALGTSLHVSNQAVCLVSRRKGVQRNSASENCGLTALPSCKQRKGSCRKQIEEGSEGRAQTSTKLRSLWTSSMQRFPVRANYDVHGLVFLVELKVSGLMIGDRANTYSVDRFLFPSVLRLQGMKLLTQRQGAQSARPHHLRVATTSLNMKH